MVFTLENGGVDFVPTLHTTLLRDKVRAVCCQCCIKAPLSGNAIPAFLDSACGIQRKAGSHCLPPLAPGNMISFSNKSGKADRSIEMGVTTAHTSLLSPCGKGSGWQPSRTELSALSALVANLCRQLLLLGCLMNADRALYQSGLCVEKQDRRGKRVGLTGLSLLLHP